jgi:hypothetical protein
MVWAAFWVMFSKTNLVTLATGDAHAPPWSGRRRQVGPRLPACRASPPPRRARWRHRRTTPGIDVMNIRFGWKKNRIIVFLPKIFDKIHLWNSNIYLYKCVMIEYYDRIKFSVLKKRSMYIAYHATCRSQSHDRELHWSRILRYFRAIWMVSQNHLKYDQIS